MIKLRRVAFFVSAFAAACLLSQRFAGAAATADPNAGVEQQVESYFADIPVMVSIARCESGFRQFAPDGSVLYGGTGDAMVGIFQIASGHSAEASALGFDIGTVAGNLSYARFLFGEQGTEPWISSFSCWNPAAATSSAAVAMASSTPALTADLSLGEIGPQVLVLQRMLNQAGFTLASSGPGSPGDETEKFGALTHTAVERFQCAQGIACSGDEYSTGYGYVDARTRTALAAISGDAPAGSTGTATVAVAATSSVLAVAADGTAQLAELQLQVKALTAIVAQLEQQLAAKFR